MLRVVRHVFVLRNGECGHVAPYEYYAVRGLAGAWSDVSLGIPNIKPLKLNIILHHIKSEKCMKYARAPDPFIRGNLS